MATLADPQTQTATRLAVHVVLDRSGSMEIIRDETISSFNAYVEQLAKDTPGAMLSLTQFDSQGIDLVINGEDISHVKPLNRDTYQPRSYTPLYDAIG